MVLNKLNEVLESKYYKMQINDPNLESIVSYTPKITAWNEEIATLEGKLDYTKQQIFTCEGGMKGERHKDEKTQTRLAHLLKKLNHKKESSEEQIRCIKTEKNNFNLDTRVKSGYKLVEAYKMVKNTK